MTIREAMNCAQKQLETAGIEDAASGARLLCSYVMKEPLGRLPLLYREIMPEDRRQEYLRLISRRAQGEPAQYIIGETQFMGLDFRVDPRALIPRPETELLVEKVVEWLETEWHGPALAGNQPMDLAPALAGEQPMDLAPALAGNQPTPPAVLDLCCGSGAIGLAVAKMYPMAAVTLADLSPEALSLAAENAQLLGLQDVKLLEGDLFAAVGDSRFDMIATNPPYIPTATIETLQEEVRLHEPRLALDGGGDGLDLYRRIVFEARDHLLPGGALMMEIGADQAEAVTKLFDEAIRAGAGWATPSVIKDLAGRDRIITAVYAGCD